MYVQTPSHIVAKMDTEKAQDAAVCWCVSVHCTCIWIRRERQMLCQADASMCVPYLPLAMAAHAHCIPSPPSTKISSYVHKMLAVSRVRRQTQHFFCMFSFSWPCDFPLFIPSMMLAGMVCHSAIRSREKSKPINNQYQYVRIRVWSWSIIFLD